MKRQVTFKITISDDGETAQINLPDGKGKQRDSEAVAGLTESLAKRLGTIEERHIGKWDARTGEHYHDHANEHETQSNGGAA